MAQFVIGGPGIMIKLLAGIFSCDCDFAPIDLQSIIPSPQRHPINPAVLVLFMVFSIPLTQFHLLNFAVFAEKLNLFIEGDMRI